MLYDPRYIIYWVISRYLSEEQIIELKKDLGEGKFVGDKRTIN